MVKFEHQPTSIHRPVLIVGGGITGLSAALFLQQQRIPFLLVERHAGTAIQPKSRTIDVRTMELFRELGLSHTLREAGKAMAPSWGILHGQNLVTALQHRASAAKTLPGSLNELAQLQALAAQSPESVCRCTQDISEAVLWRTALERGGDLRFNHELTQFHQTGQHVRATVRNRETGQELQVTADYLIGADGANSPIRNEIKAAMTGAGTIAHFLNIYFEADLADLVKGREFSQFLIREPDMTGFLLSINNNDRWAFHLKFHPEKGEERTDYPASRLIPLLQRVIGVADLPIRILSVLPWPLAVRITDELQFGRIFLAGDAAHTMTPYAGKGANSGVQDVHNLAWKLGSVIRGEGADPLLATYCQERQPVDAFYAWLSGEMAAADGLVDDQKLAGQVENLLGLPNYAYRSRAIAGGLAHDQAATYFTGQPGTRLPHLWVDEQNTESSLDWIQGRFILVVSGASDHWESLASEVTHRSGHRLPVYHFAQSAQAQRWQALTSTNSTSALLIRPDGFVAAHVSLETTVEGLVQLMDRVLAIHS